MSEETRAERPDHPQPLVTEAMKGAGAEFLEEHGLLQDGADNATHRRWLAEEIYLAMRKCAPFDGHPTREARVEDNDGNYHLDVADATASVGARQAGASVSSQLQQSFERDVRGAIIAWLQRNWSLLQDGGYPELDELSRTIRLRAGI